MVGRPNSIVVPHSNIRVADLIDYNKGERDIKGLSHWFDKDSVSAILSIPLSSS